MISLQETIVDRIVARLVALGKTVSGAAVEAGMSNSAIRDILSGKSKSPSVSTLVAIAGVLDCSLSYLIGEDEKEPAKKPTLSKFWMVYGVGQRGPTFQHYSQESAAREADRLAQLTPGTSFVVLEAKTAVQAQFPQLTEITVADDGDDIPF